MPGTDHEYPAFSDEEAQRAEASPRRIFARVIHPIKQSIMCIITAKEFDADPKKFFDLAERETVVVTRSNGKSVRIDAIDDEDMPSPEELESIRRGLEDIRHGRTHRMLPGESLDEFIDRIEPYVSNLCIK